MQMILEKHNIAHLSDSCALPPLSHANTPDCYLATAEPAPPAVTPVNNPDYPTAIFGYSFDAVPVDNPHSCNTFACLYCRDEGLVHTRN
jgi:hypothetical protein